MEENNNIDRLKDEPAGVHGPETTTGPEAAVEKGQIKEKEKEPEIDIKQVPMDGVCGGY